MRRLVLLLTTALVATLLAGLAAPSGEAAKPRKPKRKPSAVALRITPDRVTVYTNGTRETTGLLAQVKPVARGRVVTFQQRVGAGWRTVGRASTDATGRAYRPLPDARGAGDWAYRVTLAGTTRFKPATSTVRGLYARPNTVCAARPAPVDAQATGEAHCLLARLDRWQAGGLMGVGQQVNVSNKDGWSTPLTGIRPAVIGFDLEELSVGDKAPEDGPYVNQTVQGLLDRAEDGAVLVASWHARNPFDGSSFSSARRDIRPLAPAFKRTEAQQVVFDAFWADWDRKLALLKRFQDGDSDGNGDNGSVDGERAAVVVRPLHEPNGAFFWWGQPDPTAYRAIWAEMQRRAAVADVHNVVWAYSGNRKTISTTDPAVYAPTRVDIGGLDTYDPERGAGNATDALGLEGYNAVDRAPGISRMALTEVGPHGSADGSWNPAVVTATVRRAGISPLWAMLWFDDSGYADAGKKQLTSLRGGRAWLASCFNSLCTTR